MYISYFLVAGIVPALEHLPPPETEKARELLTFGPMVRYAEDLGLLMRALSATCDRDLRLDAPVDLKRLRVYYLTSNPRSFGVLPVSSEIERCIMRAAKHLEQCGARTEKVSYYIFALTSRETRAIASYYYSGARPGSERPESARGSMLIRISFALSAADR